MNTELASIFTDENAEFLSILNPTPGIDMMDWPLTPPQTSALFASANSYNVTPPMSEHGEYEIEFDLSNTFWGCAFNFGSAPNIPDPDGTLGHSAMLSAPNDCGANIRRAIAHLIDKNTFTATDSAVSGTSTPVDNEGPPSAEL